MCNFNLLVSLLGCNFIDLFVYSQASVREIMRDQPASSSNPANRKRKQKEITLEPEADVYDDDGSDSGSEDDFSQDEDYVATSEDFLFDDDEAIPVVQRRPIPDVQESQSVVGRKKLSPRAPKAASKPRPRAPPTASAAPLLSSRKRAEVPVHPHQLISEVCVNYLYIIVCLFLR